MTAFGRKQPFDLGVFQLIERPLLRKADIRKHDPGLRNQAREIKHLNVRFTPESRHSANIGLKGRL